MQSVPPGSVQMAVASQLRSAGHRERFLELSRRTAEWLHRQPGFLRYELFETEAGWLDTMLWRSRAAMETANVLFAETDISAAFTQIVEPTYRRYQGAAVQLD